MTLSKYIFLTNLYTYNQIIVYINARSNLRVIQWKNNKQQYMLINETTPISFFSIISTFSKLLHQLIQYANITWYLVGIIALIPFFEKNVTFTASNDIKMTFKDRNQNKLLTCRTTTTACVKWNWWRSISTWTSFAAKTIC